MYTIDELRKKYLDFFKTKDHAIILSSSLIPDNDPTALFTTAGMHPLVPYLMGERHPEGKRLVDPQKSREMVMDAYRQLVEEGINYSTYQMLE